MNHYDAETKSRKKEFQEEKIEGMISFERKKRKKILRSKKYSKKLEILKSSWNSGANQVSCESSLCLHEETIIHMDCTQNVRRFQALVTEIQCLHWKTEL